MKLPDPIGMIIKFFARARVRKYSSALAHRQAVLMFVSFCIVFPPIFSFGQEPQFIRGEDSTIYGIVLDHRAEATTRQQMQITADCSRVKRHATAMTLVGSEGAAVVPEIKSTRGILVLEGLRADAEPKILHTALLGAYKNYPNAIPGEIGIQPGPRYPLALTLAASLAGEGELVIQKGDYVIIHADNQLYAYYLPEITIPSEGLLRLSLGTDDTLYFDAALTHPVHSGACAAQGRPNER